MIAPAYLGDGVYASFDHRGLVITTGHHLPEKADNVIVLEPFVIAELEKYVEKAKASLTPKTDL